MKIALVHDYLKEFGGAERVLMALHEMWPDAPIYTAFCQKNSSAGKAFANATIIESKYAPLIKYKNLFSPLRFLTPLIWKSFDLSNFDLVISSSSWYISRGFKTGPKTKVFCYCHTPPRWLYGYQTSQEWQRYWLVRVYGKIIAHFLRLYDFETSQKVDQFIANSKNTAQRIKKFYRREATIIYPPVEVEKIKRLTKGIKAEDFYLIVSRIVGAKGIELAIKAAKKAKVHLKIVGESAGLSWLGKDLKALQEEGIEFLGRLPDDELFETYAQCKAFLALAKDEDFGITVIEAMAAGRPVIAYRGGGYLETVVEGKTGVFIDKLEIKELEKKIIKFDRGLPGEAISLHGTSKSANPKTWGKECRSQAEKFSKERFKKEIKEFIERKWH